MTPKFFLLLIRDTYRYFTIICPEWILNEENNLSLFDGFGPKQVLFILPSLGKYVTATIGLENVLANSSRKLLYMPLIFFVAYVVQSNVRTDEDKTAVKRYVDNSRQYTTKQLFLADNSRPRVRRVRNVDSFTVEMLVRGAKYPIVCYSYIHVLKSNMRKINSMVFAISSHD